MGIYLNPGPTGFQQGLNSRIYVDKTGLIRETNQKLYTEQKFICVSRPRRFGKSMAMNMLAAYYACGQDNRSLFEGLEIAGDESFDKHLNRYNVLKINMQNFLTMTGSVDELLSLLQKILKRELKSAYPEADDDMPLIAMMAEVFAGTGRPFVILIDEWDCLFREYKDDQESQRKYLDFLRGWMKDQDYVALAYMTGILPVKKYGTHSALNMFTEYSMTNPRELAPYFGFTEEEVKALCKKHRMSYAAAQAWYDGYELSNVESADLPPEDDLPDDRIPEQMPEAVYSMYNPKAVVEAMLSHRYDSYWNQTETYEALKVYIQMNMAGLKDAVLQMLAGEPVEIDISGFSNDMTTFSGRDDVLTLLVHLGYLTYHWKAKTVTIPNKEVAQVYMTSIKRMEGWDEVAQAVVASKKLLQALWDGDKDTVAQGIDRAHNEISILKYNDENSLACCVTLAFYYAREYYTTIREMPTGKGFADVVFLPRPMYPDKPAVVMELKKNLSAEGAIAQIKEKHYCDALKDYHGNLLLCGINYDADKGHTCIIEASSKPEK